MANDICTMLFSGSCWFVEQTLVQASKHAKEAEISISGQVTDKQNFVFQAMRKSKRKGIFKTKVTQVSNFYVCVWNEAKTQSKHRDTLVKTIVLIDCN